MERDLVILNLAKALEQGTQALLHNVVEVLALNAPGLSLPPSLLFIDFCGHGHIQQRLRRNYLLSR